MKSYSAEIKVSKKVGLPRSCSSCQHVWTGLIEISASKSTESKMNGPSEAEKLEARAQVMKELEGREKELLKTGDPNREVLCPRCGHFDTGAMEKHFPNGYAEGMTKIFKGAMWGNLWGALFSGAILFFPVRSLFNFLFGGEEKHSILTDIKDWFGDSIDNDVMASIPGFIITVVIIVGLSYFFLTSAGTFNKAFSNGNRIKQLLGETPVEGLLALAVEAYKKNKNNLAGGDGWVHVLSKAVRLQSEEDPSN